jgi:hypothetical protein
LAVKRVVTSGTGAVSNTRAANTFLVAGVDFSASLLISGAALDFAVVAFTFGLSPGFSDWRGAYALEGLVHAVGGGRFYLLANRNPSFFKSGTVICLDHDA